MKFDFCIGNPPYQDNTIGENDTFAPPVYDKFMDAAFEIADKVELIHPARFLFNAGSTPKAWNEKMLNDVHFKVLACDPNSKNVFPNTDIKGGVAISYRDVNTTYPPIEVFSPYLELNSVRQRVNNRAFVSFSSIIDSAYAYHFEDILYDENPDLIGRLSKGHQKDIKSNVFDLLPEILYVKKPDDSDDYAQILGRKDNERAYRFIKKKYIKGPASFNKYKVFIAGANGSGAIGETMSTPLIGTPLIGTTESFISIGCFDTHIEAEYCEKYVKTKFARALLGILKVTQAITPGKWKYVPLQDFTEKSDIDWSKSVHEIDLQLYKKYGLTDDEITFIETHVKEMA